MPQDIIVSAPATAIFLPLVSIVLLAAAIIIGLDCVWRLSKRMDVFMKFLTVAVIARIVMEIITLLVPEALALRHAINILSALLLLIAMIEMYRIIRTWDNENPPKDHQL